MAPAELLEHLVAWHCKLAGPPSERISIGRWEHGIDGALVPAVGNTWVPKHQSCLLLCSAKYCRADQSAVLVFSSQQIGSLSISPQPRTNRWLSRQLVLGRLASLRQTAELAMEHTGRTRVERPGLLSCCQLVCDASLQDAAALGNWLSCIVPVGSVAMLW